MHIKNFFNLIFLIVIIYLFKITTPVFALLNFEIMSGFPINTIGDFYGSGAVADIDADGVKEFIIGDKSGYLYVVLPNGQIKTGFPVYLGNAIWSSPAIADIDNDGYAEIIIGSRNNQLHIIRYDGSNQRNFPKQLTQEVRAAPNIADVDKNGTLDIIFPALDGYIYVIDYLGNNLPGWPQRIVEGTNDDYVYNNGARQSAVITDIDNDGYPEISVGANGGIITGFNYRGNRLYNLRTSGNIDPPPIAADLDNDSISELIFYSWDYNVYVFNIKSSVTGGIEYKPGFPVYSGGRGRHAPVVYDINNDGKLDLTFWLLDIYQGSNPLRQILYNGTVIYDTIVFSGYGGATPITCGDIDNDGAPDFLIGSHSKFSRAYNLNKELLWQYDYTNLIESAAVLNDFDNDGYLDIIVPTEDERIFVFKTNTPINYEKIIVSKFRNNLNNNGNYSMFSTPLIYSPRSEIIRDSNVVFRWLSMEGVNTALSSYSLNNSAFSQPELINEKSYANLADGIYEFRVHQYNNNVRSYSPAYKKIIIDTTKPIAQLNKFRSQCGGANLVFSGIAADSNFGYYNFLIYDSTATNTIVN